MNKQESRNRSVHANFWKNKTKQQKRNKQTIKVRELLQTSISSRNTESFYLEKTDCVGSEITEQLIWNAYDVIGISQNILEWYLFQICATHAALLASLMVLLIIKLFFLCQDASAASLCLLFWILEEERNRCWGTSRNEDSKAKEQVWSRWYLQNYHPLTIWLQVTQLLWHVRPESAVLLYIYITLPAFLSNVSSLRPSLSFCKYYAKETWKLCERAIAQKGC